MIGLPFAGRRKSCSNWAGRFPCYTPRDAGTGEVAVVHLSQDGPRNWAVETLSSGQTETNIHILGNLGIKLKYFIE